MKSNEKVLSNLTEYLGIVLEKFEGLEVKGVVLQHYHDEGMFSEEAF